MSDAQSAQWYANTAQLAQMLGLAVADSEPWADSEPNFDPCSGYSPRVDPKCVKSCLAEAASMG